MDIQYIYLIQTREFVNSKEPIYKVGKTKQSNYSRFLQYPNGSIQLFQCVCNNCDILERHVIKIFKNKYENHKIAGREYFKGELRLMILDLCNIIYNEKVGASPIKTFKNNNNNDKNIVIENIAVKDDCINKSNIENYKYACKMCRFSTNNNICFKTHLLTKKHLRNTQPIENKSKRFQCKHCDNNYKYASGLSIHTKMCLIKKKVQEKHQIDETVLYELKKINGRLDGIKSSISDV